LFHEKLGLAARALPALLEARHSVAGFQIGSRTTPGDQRVWKPAIGSLAPARSALWALPSLRSGNPFRGFPSRSSQQVWKPALRFVGNCPSIKREKIFGLRDLFAGGFIRKSFSLWVFLVLAFTGIWEMAGDRWDRSKRGVRA